MDWELWSAASLFPPATASDQAAAAERTEVFRAQPARGVVPHAHTITKIAKVDGLASIVRDPKDLPPPVGTRGPQRVKVDLETVEITGKLADGAAYRYWTFNQKVPGPFVRARVGDTVEVRLKNHDDSAVMHNVDFHAVTGRAAAPKRLMRHPASRAALNSLRSNPAFMSITAPCRWRRSTSPTACMA